jgi:hypothetical protein
VAAGVAEDQVPEAAHLLRVAVGYVLELAAVVAAVV